MGLEKTTGQPTKVKLGEKEYELFPITMNDVGALKQYIRDREIEMLNKVENENVQIKLIEKAMQRKIGQKELDSFMQTIEGMAFMFWKMSRSETTLEEFRKLIELEGLEKNATIAKGVNGTPEKK